MQTVKIRAYAKINIGLQVLNLREDGYHNINTIFTPIELYDELELTENKIVDLKLIGNDNIPKEKNLAFKAALLFNNELNLSDEGVYIKLKKNIPSGAGLGGGSSDAAAVLNGLQKLRGLNHPNEILRKIALNLGSDVPYFLNKGTATGSGRGEILEYFEYQIPYTIALVYPEINISTEIAYKNLQRTNTIIEPYDFKTLLMKSLKEPEILKNNFFNDFETVVFRQYPEIGQIKNTFYQSGAVYSQMTGSGSAVFAFFENREKANSALAAFKGYRTFICN